MVEDAMRFLRELRQLRREAGMESAELAARAHYPHDVIVAAEAGPGLPELPVLSAYVRGCGGELAEWEERWRSVTGSHATSLHLPARPAGCSSLAEAGAQAAYSSPAVDPEDQRRIMAAITRAAVKSAAAPAPARQSPASSPSGAAAAAELAAATAPGVVAEAAAPGAAAAPAVAAEADSGLEPPAASGAASAIPPAATAATAVRRGIAARRASFPYGAGIAAMVAAIMCIVGMILLLLR
jgi:DNA-binding XRE family transcriptional regulator